MVIASHGGQKVIADLVDKEWSSKSPRGSQPILGLRVTRRSLLRFQMGKGFSRGAPTTLGAENLGGESNFALRD